MKLAERGQSLRGSERPLIAMIVGVGGVPASFPALAALAALLFSASPLRAQVVQPPATADTNVVLPPIDVSPGGVFLRAALVPGWGHVAIGSYTRGAFYFSAQTATVYTLLRARTRIGTAQDRVRLTKQVVLAELASAGVTDPEAIQQALNGDERLNGVRGLLEARQEQQEDLVALGIFLVLLSAADAYVSAHLARFPDPLDLETNVSSEGAVELGFRVALPN